MSTAKACRTQSGEFFRADLVVWAAGIMAPPVLRTLDGLEANRANQLIVGATCRRHAMPTSSRSATVLPHRGSASRRGDPAAARQVAHQQATLLVKSMKARLAGRPLPEFRFHDFGSLVSLGQLSAVGTLMGRLIGGSMMIQGLIARIMYASLYKMHQVSIMACCRGAGHAEPLLRERPGTAGQAALLPASTSVGAFDREVSKCSSRRQRIGSGLRPTIPASIAACSVTTKAAGALRSCGYARVRAFRATRTTAPRKS
jgi:hypothetical protein